MKVLVQDRDGVVVVRVSGAVEGHAAAELFDILLNCVGDGTAKLIVDLSGVHIMARSTVRGLVVAAKLVEPGRGAMRICSAPRSIEDFLQSLGFNHLLRCDPSLRSSMMKLGVGGDQEADAAPAVTPLSASAPAGVPEQRSLDTEDSEQGAAS